jgi:hypothetical protein
VQRDRTEHTEAELGSCAGINVLRVNLALDIPDTGASQFGGSGSDGAACHVLGQLNAGLLAASATAADRLRESIRAADG